MRSGPAWDETLAGEPAPWQRLHGEAIDRALAAMGEFADLVSPYLVGHSAGVADLAVAAAERCRLPAAELVAVRRAALVHDVGRVAVPARVWQQAAPLTPDEWERVRLHAYHSERILCRSPFLAGLAPVATAHHERLDGTGYHRGASAPALTPPARVLAAADAYHAMTEPRPHREALPPQRAAEVLGREADAGRLDAASVAAVLAAAGHRAPRVARPAGLDGARDPGRRAGRSRPADQADRARARHLGQDRGPPPAERLRQDRGLDAGRRRPVRHAARTPQLGRTPDIPAWRPLLASPLEQPAIDQVPAQREVAMTETHAARSGGRDLVRDGLDERRLPRWTSLAAWAGIVGPILFTATFLAQEAFRSDEYSPIAETVSALEAGPNGWVQQLNFVVFGLLTIAFAIGLHRGVRQSRAGIVGPALLAVSGVGLLLAAVLPLRQDAAGVTYDPGGHVVAGSTFFLSATGLIVLSRRLARDPRWRSIAAYRSWRGSLRWWVRARRRTGDAGRCSAARVGRPGPAVAHPCRRLSLPDRPVAQVAAGRNRAAVIPQ